MQPEPPRFRPLDQSGTTWNQPDPWNPAAIPAKTYLNNSKNYLNNFWNYLNNFWGYLNNCRADPRMGRRGRIQFGHGGVFLRSGLPGPGRALQKHEGSSDPPPHFRGPSRANGAGQISKTHHNKSGANVFDPLLRRASERTNVHKPGKPNTSSQQRCVSPSSTFRAPSPTARS